MAVDATELRPRGAVSIFDAAVRLVTTNSGLWALTLPSGAAVIAAGLALAERIQRHGVVLAPAAWWTAAWLFRALSQAAACHFAEQQVLGLSEPHVFASWRAALRRAPSVITTCALMLLASVCVFLFTAGIGFFFFGAHAVAYAVTMRGQGHPFKLLSTSATLLGPSRFAPGMVRLCGAVQLVLALNLHLAAAGTLSLVTSLAGFDLTYPLHFVSISNPVWLTVVALTTFTLFEPLRAASAALLLIDGRVRQEGLDLVAAVEQLPPRKKPAIITAALLMLVAGSTHAAGEGASAERSRLERLGKQCHMSARLDRVALDDLDALDEKQRNAAHRFVSRVERRAVDEEDCDGALTELKIGLQQIHAARRLNDEVSAEASRAEAQAILALPEFQVAPEAAVPEAEAADETGGFFHDLWVSFLKWLQRVFDQVPEPTPKVRNPVFGGPMAIASVVMLLALALVIGVGIFLIVRFTKRDTPAHAEIETSSLESTVDADPMSALSKPARTWASMADELAARGEFREAIRHLYLALLARLHADGRITYDTTRSNWEYLRELKGPAPLLGAFRDLTRRFDFAWYGHLWVDSSAYSTFRQITGPYLSDAQSDSSAAHA